MHAAEKAVKQWLTDVVIGLNLCPFSAKPAREKRVRFYISLAQDEEGLLAELQVEMERLDTTPAADIETTLIIIPELLQDFFDYHQLLNWANQLIKRMNWQGVYQLASFHPQYCFSGAEMDDPENLTNRSPYPILHIIREDSLSKALAFYPDVDEIPDRNRECMKNLSDEDKHRLFAYLFK
jgi:uncharacterized protein